MREVSKSIGNTIRGFRKNKRMTLVELAKQINKSKATVSKYEKGEIVIDIETLYDISEALDVHIHKLLYYSEDSLFQKEECHIPAFFFDLSRFYAYIYDGRIDKIVKCAFDITSKHQPSTFNIMMYMNFENYENYTICENTYSGLISHHDALTNIVLNNRDTKMEQVNISILASFLDSNTKWGLFTGISSRPMMPISFKMLFSKKPLDENKELLEQLKISKDDIRMIKHYNALSVI